MELARLGLRVVAIDNSSRMLDTARAKIERAKLTRIELRQGEAGALPLADGEVDAAFAHMVLHYLPSPGEAIRAYELITYEALGLCEPGGGGDLIDSGATTYGGRWVVNPSGGLISKGHPIGATGLAQCAELTWQLRGDANKRQVEGARVALQHNLGLGGAGVVTLYRRNDP